jgi:hypothetical protein
MISRARAAALQRATPKAMRADILGALTPAPLIVADRHRAGPTVDAEVTLRLDVNGPPFAACSVLEVFRSHRRSSHARRNPIWTATAHDQRTAR